MFYGLDNLICFMLHIPSLLQFALLRLNVAVTILLFREWHLPRMMGFLSLLETSLLLGLKGIPLERMQSCKVLFFWLYIYPCGLKFGLLSKLYLSMCSQMNFFSMRKLAAHSSPPAPKNKKVYACSTKYLTLV